MESHLNFTYKFKIEAKPEGGFIARAEGSDLIIEGATKEEVEQKILEKAGAFGGPRLAEALKGVSLSDLKQQGGIHIQKKFSLSVNGKKIIGDESAGAPALEQNVSPIIMRSQEPAISRQLLWSIIIALGLLTLWLLTHRG